MATRTRAASRRCKVSLRHSFRCIRHPNPYSAPRHTFPRCRILCETLYSDGTAARHYAARFASAKYNSAYELSPAEREFFEKRSKRGRIGRKNRELLSEMKFVIIEILKGSSRPAPSLSSAPPLFPFIRGLLAYLEIISS